MNSVKNHYRGYGFPPEIISHAVWLYYRFCLSFRDTEDLLAERGITVSYETIRQWCTKFGPAYAGALKRRCGCLGDTWYMDEVFVSIGGERHTTFGVPLIRTGRLSIFWSKPAEIGRLPLVSFVSC